LQQTLLLQLVCIQAKEHDMYGEGMSILPSSWALLQKRAKKSKKGKKSL